MADTTAVKVITLPITDKMWHAVCHFPHFPGQGMQW